MISAATLVSLNWLIGILTYKSKTAEALIEGRAQLLVHNGKLNDKALADAKLTRHELMSSVREAGCGDLDEVRAAFLENDGKISVIPKAK